MCLRLLSVRYIIADAQKVQYKRSASPSSNSEADAMEPRDMPLARPPIMAFPGDPNELSASKSLSMLPATERRRPPPPELNEDCTMPVAATP